MLITVGWWLARPKGSSPSDPTVQGWVPSAYVEEIVVEERPPPPPPPATRPVPTAPSANGSSDGPRAGSKSGPPVPPSKRPASKRTVPNRPGGGSNDSRAGGLAEALRARQAAMSSKRDDDDW